PRTAGQALYVQAIRDSDLVFAVGPAGTGKTFLAVAMAVEALKHQDVRRIVLVRPAVEAGESLGYLPGDLHAKINPYLRPLFDALQSLIGFDTMKQFMEQDIIEVVPLAYMRGRTLDQAFIILDEAQNTTVSQMKMFLTRMGADSKIVVSGDTTQIDLPLNTSSGLIDATRRLAQIQGVSSLELTAADIVRHPLVQQIVSAYETHPEKSANNRNKKRS
ncbi:MAG: PhoH family protein, partial [Planctomycetaceae bacterium]|nr:PhoH family protein [Planctomycetaceae bacterium]